MEVVEKAQLFKFVGDDDEDMVFDRTKIIVHNKIDGNYYYTLSPRRIPDESTVTPLELEGLEFTKIPVDHIWPVFDQRLTKAAHPTPKNAYVKKQSLLGYWNDTKLAPHVLDEAAVCEKLKRSPHPHIAQFLGCVVQDNRITGLCFKRYDMTLGEKVTSGVPFDRQACLRGIEDGVSHLHSLGLSHNDINPDNVMVDRNGANPVIIDFGSCKPDGYVVGIELGTDGWVPKGMTRASKENDLYALEKMREYLA